MLSFERSLILVIEHSFLIASFHVRPLPFDGIPASLGDLQDQDIVKVNETEDMIPCQGD